MAKKQLKHYDSDSDVESYLQQHQSDVESDDEMATISFGALKSAQETIDEEEGKSSNKAKKSKRADKEKAKELKESLKRELALSKLKKKVEEPEPQSDSEMSEGLFEEEDELSSDDDDERPTSRSSKDGKKKGKHAPSEQSSKRPVPKIRKIPGLETPKDSSLYKDIRFDTAFGKADMNKIRKDYKFLDEYRQQEIGEINKMLKDPKMRNKLSQREINDLEYQAKSLRSRLDTLKNRDLQQDVLKKYKEEHGIKGKFFLKKSDQRKIVQKHKFENMKSKQREKVVERKRKRRLGKEFKQLEFNSRSDR